MYHLITRPDADLEPFRSEVEALGLQTQHDPVFNLVFLKPEAALRLDDVQALLMTSANGVRAFAQSSSRRDLTVLAVGDSTARQAELAGFARVFSASGDIGSLVRLVQDRIRTGDGVLFHPAASVLAGELGQELEERGFDYRKEVLYEARKADALKPGTGQLLKDGKIGSLSFFSPRSARTFMELVARAGLEDHLEGLPAFCLSPAVCEALGENPALQGLTSEKPERLSLLSLMKKRLSPL